MSGAFSEGNPLHVHIENASTLMPVFIVRPDQPTLPVLVYLKGFVDFELGRAAAIALLTMGIMFILMLLYTRGLKWAESRQ